MRPRVKSAAIVVFNHLTSLKRLRTDPTLSAVPSNLTASRMPETLDFVHALYRDFFARGVHYFFPDARLYETGAASEIVPALNFLSLTDGSLRLEWLGAQYHLISPDNVFTEDELRLLGAMGGVLSARYRGIFSPGSSTFAPHLFEGLFEDRYVSAFLDHFPYFDGDGVPAERDVVADAISVLRQSSLITYENRRISTGVILIGAGSDPYHAMPQLPEGAQPYTSALVSIKSFHRLCDGLNTVFLVDRKGMLLDLVDIEQFAEACCGAAIPAPSAARYRAHSLVTLKGGHLCLVLTPNGEIKVFGGGVQIFHFLEGRWRLTDLVQKYHEFHRTVGDARLAERLFTVALNLAENRRGGLFVVLDDPEAAGHLVAPGDLLEETLAEGTTKSQIHYLLCRKRAMELEPSVLQSIARVDGGIVMDREGCLLAFGAILRSAGEPMVAQEGGRTTAAVHASRYGLALKISEDGIVSFYRAGNCVWEI